MPGLTETTSRFRSSRPLLDEFNAIRSLGHKEVPELPAIREQEGPVAPPDFEAILRFVQKRRDEARRDFTAVADLKARFLEELDKSEVVSFDIFDTLLLRYVDHPSEVFLHLESQPEFARHALGGRIGKLRVAAEAATRQVALQYIASSEVNLDEIYQVFCDRNGIPAQCASSLVAAEERVEMLLCFPAPAIEPLYRAAIAAGKRVIFVTDIYHRQSFLLQLLAANGYEADASCLFASSVIRKSKGTGQLFPHVLAALGIEAKAMLHVGDHPVSDFEAPRNLGVRCILHPFKASQESSTLMTIPNDVMEPLEDTFHSRYSVLRGIVHAARQRATACGRDEFYWKFGYRSVGPLAVGFCQWLEQGLRDDGIEHAYFLLRDGALLFKVYRLLCAEKADACPASTLISSRRAALLPTLEFAPSFVLPSSFVGIGKRPVRDYIDRLGICADSFTWEALQAGFASLDEEVDGRFETLRLTKFVLQKRLMSALLARGRGERFGLMKYLEQNRLFEQERAGIVDLGWACTIQKCFHLLLPHYSPKTKLTGYYIGTHRNAGTQRETPDLVFRSYVMHEGKPFEIARQLNHFLPMFEDIFSSTEGSVLHFRMDEAQPEKDAAAIPVLQAPDRSEKECREIQAIHDGALAFAADFLACPAVRSSPPMPAALAQEQFFRVFNRPTPEEAAALGEMAFCENLGSSITHPAARLRATNDPGEMLKNFQQAHWKQGMLAHPTPAGAAMQMLTWLLHLHEE